MKKVIESKGHKFETFTEVGTLVKLSENAWNGLGELENRKVYDPFFIEEAINNATNLSEEDVKLFNACIDILASCKVDFICFE